MIGTGPVVPVVSRTHVTNGAQLTSIDRGEIDGNRERGRGRDGRGRGRGRGSGGGVTGDRHSKSGIAYAIPSTPPYIY